MKKLLSIFVLVISIFLISCNSSKIQEEDKLNSNILQEPEDFEEPFVYEMNDSLNIQTDIIQEPNKKIDSSTQTKQEVQNKQTSNSQKNNEDSKTKTQNVPNTQSNQTNKTKQETQSNKQNTQNNITSKQKQETQSNKQNTNTNNQKQTQNSTATKQEQQENQQKQSNNNASVNQNKVQNPPKVTDNKNTIQAEKKNASNSNQNQTNNEQKQAAQSSQASNKQSSEQNLTTDELQVLDQEPIAALTEEDKNIIIPSRKVTMNVNETLSINYPGYGWIYLGSDNEDNNLVSTGRKTSNNQTFYTLTARKAGTQIHHFYKVDSLSGKYIDDYIEVQVQDIKGSVYHIVKAPEYGDIVPEKPNFPFTKTTEDSEFLDLKQEEQIAKDTTNNKRDFITLDEQLEEEQTQDVQSNPLIQKEYIESLSAEDILQKAKELFNQKNYVESLQYVSFFLEISTDNRDEALYLQGQILEQDGQTKDIKQAINIYKSIVQNYPSSLYYEDANKRIIYLNRFYIQIR